MGLGVALSTPSLPVLAAVPLQKVDLNEQGKTLEPDQQLWGSPDQPGDYKALLQAIDNSLRYLDTPSAAKAYQQYPVSGITRTRVRRSLVRFRELLINSPTPEALQAAVAKEFDFYQATGKDNKGTVSFTGYFEPVYTASRTRTAEYRYPLYRKTC